MCACMVLHPPPSPGCKLLNDLIVFDSYKHDLVNRTKVPLTDTGCHGGLGSGPGMTGCCLGLFATTLHNAGVHHLQFSLSRNSSSSELIASSPAKCEKFPEANVNQRLAKACEPPGSFV